MRFVLLPRAVLCAALVLALAPSTSFAQAHADIAELRTHCVSQRTAALTEMFGPDYNAEQGRVVDERIVQSMDASTPAQLAEAYQAFEPNVFTARPAADRYAQCLHGARLRQLDPNADLQTVLRGEYAQPAGAPAPGGAWGAALSRNNGNTSAGSTVLAQSADPASRAARQRQNAALREQAEARIVQRRAQSAAFWGAVLQAATIAAETYVAVENAQAQAEVDATAAQAQQQASMSQDDQNSAPASSSQHQAQTTPCAPAGTVYYYGQGNCGGSNSRPVSSGGGACARVEATGHSFPVGANAGQYERYDYRLVNGCGIPVVFAIVFANGSTRDVTVTGTSRDWFCTVGFLGNTDCVGGIARWSYR